MIPLKKLISNKDKIESEIDSLLEVSREGEPLIDAEGFPRADIDVYAIRVARNSLARLRTDHQLLMKEIENGLADLHAEARKLHGKTESASEQSSGNTLSAVSKPFARVESVENSSPAEKCGIMNGDRIVQLGSISISADEAAASNFVEICKAKLNSIPHIVSHSFEENKPLRVLVLRQGREVNANEILDNVIPLSLQPTRWEGRGLVGCKIVPCVN